MIVHTDEGLVSSRRRIGRIASIAGLVVLGLGLFVSFNQASRQGDQVDTFQALILPYLTLIVGLVLVTVGKANNVRWGGRFPPHEVLTNGLKSLDNRHRLYNYTTGIPCDHLLVTPNGLIVFDTKPTFGNIRNEGDRWSRQGGVAKWLVYFTEGGLGNPSREAIATTDRVKKWLSEQLGEEIANRLPVQTAIVFTHPRAALTVENPAIPVILGKDVRSFVRGPDKKNRLPADAQKRLTELLAAYEAKKNGNERK